MGSTRLGRLPLLALIVVITIACSGNKPGEPPTSTAHPVTPTVTAPTATPSPAVEPTPEASPTVAPVAEEPVGYPLPVDAATDLVVGEAGDRTISPGFGGTVRDVSAQRHPSADAAYSNAAGWNCRVHVEYEGAPAVDWYIGRGTPVIATRVGTAILIMNTTVNAFDYYGVDREPYIGDPDRARAPITPFPGPGGGMGLYVAVVGSTHRTDYGHLDVSATVRAVPAGAFAAPYSADYDYAAAFGAPRPLSEGTQIATWAVRRGDVVGFTGDTGYSEAPHLHYEVTRLSDGVQLCPTTEQGFADGGWLER